MKDRHQIDLTRRRVIQALGWLTVIPLAGLWDYMIERDQSGREGNIVKVLLIDIPPGQTYYGDYLISRFTGGIEVFSMKCTHLGCRLKPSGEGQLVCPCHGSAFDPESKTVIKGPALNPLEKLESAIEGDFLIINLF